MSKNLTDTRGRGGYLVDGVRFATFLELSNVVDLLRWYSNNPAHLYDLRATLKALAEDDPADDEPELGRQPRRTRRGWSMAERLSVDGLREVAGYYRAGMTARELAEKFSVSLSSIKRILRANGACRREPG